jgi:hypothetical protein
VCCYIIPQLKAGIAAGALEDMKRDLLGRIVFDRLEGTFNHGAGNTGVHPQARDPEWLKQAIPKEQFKASLDNFHQKQLAVKATGRANRCGPEGKILLALHAMIVTPRGASEKLSWEHLVPVRVFAEHQLSAPINCVANTCFMPGSLNARKGGMSLYEHFNKKGLIDKRKVFEERYAMVKLEDMRFIQRGFNAEEYIAFLNARWKELQSKYVTYFYK